MSSSPYRCTHFYTTHTQYLFSIVPVTLLNSWLLTDAWGCLCVSGLQTSAALHSPLPFSSIPLVSLLSSRIKQETCSPNNLPPQSPGTTAFHQRHCFSLLPPHVLLHHGNTHPPSSLSHLWTGPPCVTRVPAATPLYVDGT